MTLHMPVFTPAQARWEHTRLRRRMLEGIWHEDLKKRLQELVGKLRQQAWGPADITKNNFRSVVHQLSTLYTRKGSIANADPASAERMDALLDSAGWWQLAIRHQRMVVGLRESFVRVSVTGQGDDARLVLRLVPPDLMHAEASIDDPDQPHTVVEWRQRMVKQPGTSQEKLQWTRDVMSIQDLSQPYYRVMSEDGKRDLSDQFLTAADGSREVWPSRWRDAAGVPVLPYVMYHAVRTGSLWDAFEGVELVSGSLTIAVLWTYWNHIVRDCSHPQRALANTRPAGGARTDNPAEVPSIPEDPAAILLFEGVSGATPVFHQWQPGGDPEKLGRAIRDYASDLAIDYGISPTDIDRTHGNAQSGYAVALSRDGVREAQLTLKPEAARGDRQLCRVVALQWNRATSGSLAEDGYQPHYTGLKKSADEVRLQLEQLQLEVELGLASKVDVYQRVHGVTREEAQKRLAEVRQDNIAAA